MGDKICIAGNVPASLIISGTPEEVRYYCKKLIDTCAPGGGFILSPGSSLDEANPRKT
uniref:Uroporphyrinogen decarboxylase (URO-D) domain-containing protein n=1 Tax=candidate division WOR-3 bacterium TaxID=2052148 RepID=A0A7C2K279_UNCW3